MKKEEIVILRPGGITKEMISQTMGHNNISHANEISKIIQYSNLNDNNESNNGHHAEVISKKENESNDQVKLDNHTKSKVEDEDKKITQNEAETNNLLIDEMINNNNITVESPGMKYKHYAPNKPF